MSDKPVSTWTRFRAPPPADDSRPLDATIFQPLIARRADYRDAFYGRVAESPDQCILVIAWNSGAACDAFAAAPAGGRQLLASLTTIAGDGEAVGEAPQKQRFPVITRKVDFGKEAFWWRFGPNTEVRTVYFPREGNGEQSHVREAVVGLKGLVLTMGLGIDGRRAHLSPYRGVPACGWVIGEEEEKGHGDDGSRASEFVTWEGRQASACLWIHYWKDREAEQRFKTTEKRPPPDGESHRPLATEAFEDDLRGLGALGWEDYHVDFVKVPGTI